MNILKQSAFEQLENIKVLDQYLTLFALKKYFAKAE